MFERQWEVTVHGRTVTVGTEVTITGFGRVKFLALVTNPNTGAQWVDVLDKNRMVRSFHVDRIKRVHYKRRMGR